MTGRIGAKALVPNAALRPLAFLLGDWRTEGTHPQIPGQTVLGRTTFALHEGGAFLIMRSQVDHPDFPDGVAIIGSDSDAGRFAMTYFDERGVSRLMDVEVVGRQLTWRHDSPSLAQTLALTAQSDDALVSQGRMSMNDGPWGDDLSQVFRRANTG